MRPCRRRRGGLAASEPAGGGFSPAGPLQVPGADGLTGLETLAREAGSLDLHEVLSTPVPRYVTVKATGARVFVGYGWCPQGSEVPRKGACCPRWPEKLRLVSSDGRMVPGRCRATNQCEYCARLSAVEYAEMFALDALDGEAPEVWMVLTTRTATLDTAGFYQGRRKVITALKRRWPGVRYAALVEFTTGYAAADGLRRPHWNLFFKGIPAADAARAGEIAARVWCGHVDAEPQGQFCGPVSEFGGLMRYVTLHFLKESQQPPKGWKGQRVMFSTGRKGVGGFFTRPVWKVRRDAKRALRLKRELWRAESLGWEGAMASAIAENELERQDGLLWELRVLTVDADGVIRKARMLDNSEPRTQRRRVSPAERVNATADALREFEGWRPFERPVRDEQLALWSALEIRS